MTDSVDAVAAAPEPPLQSFASDNVAGAHPAVIEALSAANVGSVRPYGDDPWTVRAVDGLRELFSPDAEVLFTYGGTGANVALLQSVLLPHEAAICPASGHINTDECGAVERIVGSKLIDVPTVDGKLRPSDIAHLLHPEHGEHNVKPAVIAISQVTELGTVYSVDEIAALAELAHANGLLLFLDGARLANAVASLGCTVREMTVDAGVDLLTFGGTKNGLLYGEAAIYLRPELAARARFARKQTAQLASKMRFISAQFEALLTNDLWLTGARNANAMAARLAANVADIDAVQLLQTPQANSLFAVLPPELIRELQAWSFFWDWNSSEHSVRWMANFGTTEEDVDRFTAGVRHFAAEHAAQA